MQILKFSRAAALFCAGAMGSCAPLASDSSETASANAPALPQAATSPARRSDVLTQRSDNGRTSATVDDAITPTALRDGSWQLLAELPVDGPVHAQPLYVEGQVMRDGRAHDVVYVATAKNKLYAFDANTLALLWKQESLEGPDPSDNTLPPGCRVLTPLSVTPSWEPRPRPERVVYGAGILSTPVIDRTAGAHGFMYVSYRTGETLPGRAKQWIARVDLATGAIGPADKRDISSHIPLGGRDLDEPSRVAGVRQRVALLLSRGMVYVAFGARCEAPLAGVTPAFPYRGAILAIDPSTLSVAGSWIGAPTDTVGVGIWQGASGIAADDATGDLHFMTGNAWAADARGRSVGLPDDTRADMVGNSFVRLTPRVRTSGSTRTVDFPGAAGPGTAADWFTPYRARWQNEGDLDLGSSGVVLPPNSGVVLGAGKEGVLYVLDRARLGGQTPGYRLSSLCAPNALDQRCLAPSDLCGVTDSTIDEPNALQHLQVGFNIDCPFPTMSNWTLWPHVHGTPAYGSVRGREYLYVWPEKGQIKVYPRARVEGFRLETRPIVGSAITPLEGMPGAMLTLATNEARTDGVLFAALPLDPDMSQTMRGGLLAFDAAPADGTLKLLWSDYVNDDTVSSTPGGRTPRNYFHAKFVPPTVARGRVFLATFSNHLRVYGPASKGPTQRAPAIAAGTTLGGTKAAMIDADGRMALLGADTRPWTREKTVGTPGQFPADAPVAIDVGDGVLSAFAVGNDQRLHRIASGPGEPEDVVLGSERFAPGAHVATRRDDDGVHVYAVNQAGTLTRWSRPRDSGTFRGGPLLGVTTQPTFPVRAGVAVDTLRKLDGTRREVIVAVDTGHRMRVFSGPPGGPYTVSFPPDLALAPGAQLATAHAHDTITLPDQLHVFAIAGDGPGASVQADAPRALSSANEVITNGSLVVASTRDLDVWELTSLQRSGIAPGVPGGAVTAVREGPTLVHVFFAGQDGRVQKYTKLYPAVDWTRADSLSAPAGLGTPLLTLPGAPVRAIVPPLSLSVELVVAVPSGVYGMTLDALPRPWRAL